MAKAELGEKQVCPSCSAKFYDLRKRPAVCPKCATSFDPADETVKMKRVRTRQPAYEPAYDDAAPARARAGDDSEEEEEEVEVTPELDAEDAADPVVLEDDEESASPDDLPPGFSEEEADLEDETANEDEIPTIEDEADFTEDEIGDIGGGDDDNDR